jgi:hypothetical protein
MESLGVLSGHVSSEGRGLNEHGDVVGASSAQIFLFGPDTIGVAWYADGTTRTLDPIGTPGVDDLYSVATAINDAGWIVGASSLGAFNEFSHPILWLPDGSRVDLMPRIPSDASWAAAAGISDTGWITGHYRDGGSGRLTAFVLRPTPATQLAMLRDQLGRVDLGSAATGLEHQLATALAKLTDASPSNDAAATALLRAFARKVERLASQGQLDAIDADSLLALANDALATLGG